MINNINAKKVISVFSNNINTILQETINQVQKMTEDLKVNYYTKSEVRLLIGDGDDSNLGITMSDVDKILNEALENYVSNKVLQDVLNSYTRNIMLPEILNPYAKTEFVQDVLSDYYTKSEIDTKLNSITFDINLDDYLKKEELDKSLSNYYTKGELQEKLNDVVNVDIQIPVGVYMPMDGWAEMKPGYISINGKTDSKFTILTKNNDVNTQEGDERLSQLVSFQYLDTQYYNKDYIDKSLSSVVYEDDQQLFYIYWDKEDGQYSTASSTLNALGESSEEFGISDDKEQFVTTSALKHVENNVKDNYATTKLLDYKAQTCFIARGVDEIGEPAFLIGKADDIIVDIIIMSGCTYVLDFSKPEINAMLDGINIQYYIDAETDFYHGIESTIILIGGTNSDNILGFHIPDDYNVSGKNSVSTEGDSIMLSKGDGIEINMLWRYLSFQER